jgi:hypothetical protein
MARAKRMTEEEWESSTNPIRMLACLRVRRKPTDRQLRLMACACARLLDVLRKPPPDFQSGVKDLTSAVRTAEAFADGQASRSDLATWWRFAVCNSRARTGAINSNGRNLSPALN